MTIMDMFLIVLRMNMVNRRSYALYYIFLSQGCQLISMPVRKKWRSQRKLMNRLKRSNTIRLNTNVLFGNPP